jgi:iron complex outermembrane recepter protein
LIQFGRNTTGGAILVNTLKPSQETSAIVDLSYGGYNSQRYAVYFTTGITDQIAADVAVMDKSTTTFRFRVTPWAPVTFRSP